MEPQITIVPTLCGTGGGELAIAVREHHRIQARRLCRLKEQIGFAIVIEITGYDPMLVRRPGQANCRI
jgi:hypothetical protein